LFFEKDRSFNKKHNDERERGNSVFIISKKVPLSLRLLLRSVISGVH
jgi:hypothetical protein